MALFKQKYPDISVTPGEHPEPGIHVEDDRGGCRQRQAGHLHGRRGARGRSRGDGRAYRPDGRRSRPGRATRNIRRRPGKVRPSTARPTAFRPSPSSTGCTTARTGSPRKASRRRRPMPEFLDAAIKVTDPSKNRYGLSLRGGAGGFKFVIDLIEVLGLADRRRRQDGDRQEEGDRGGRLLRRTS